MTNFQLRTKYVSVEASNYQELGFLGPQDISVKASKVLINGH